MVTLKEFSEKNLNSKTARQPSAAKKLPTERLPPSPERFQESKKVGTRRRPAISLMSRRAIFFLIFKLFFHEKNLERKFKKFWKFFSKLPPNEKKKDCPPRKKYWFIFYCSKKAYNSIVKKFNSPSLFFLKKLKTSTHSLSLNQKIQLES